MKNKFFVSAGRSVNLAYIKNGKVRGSRFVLKIILAADKLDKNGFVVDFLKVEGILKDLEYSLKEKVANEFTGKEDFLFEDFLLFVKEFVEKSLKESHIVIDEVSLSNDEEGYIVRFSG